MRVDEVMTRFPTTVRLGETTGRAAALVAASEVGQLMVLDADDRFVGVLSEGDLVRAILPGPDGIRAAGGTVAAGFEAFLTTADAASERPIDPVVVRDPVTIAPDAPVAAAAVVMTDRGLRRLPVLDEGRLVGTVSRLDVCRAVLTGARRTAPAVTAPAVPAAATVPATVATDAAARIADARARLAAAGRIVPGVPPTANGRGRA